MTADALAALLPLTDPEPDDLRARLESPTALVEHAAYYASVGWPVHPLVAGGKIPVTANGFKDATTDPVVVADWWRTMPKANIGLACGHRFDVIDVDTPHGFDSYARFCESLAERGIAHPEILAVAMTGGGGRHILIAPQPSSGPRASGNPLAPDLDYRGAGSYIVGPPSRLHDGGRYRWVLEPDQRLLGVVA